MNKWSKKGERFVCSRRTTNPPSCFFLNWSSETQKTPGAERIPNQPLDSRFALKPLFFPQGSITELNRTEAFSSHVKLQISQLPLAGGKLYRSPPILIRSNVVDHFSWAADYFYTLILSLLPLWEALCLMWCGKHVHCTVQWYLAQQICNMWMTYMHVT